MVNWARHCSGAHGRSIIFAVAPEWFHFQQPRTHNRRCFGGSENLGHREPKSQIHRSWGNCSPLLCFWRLKTIIIIIIIIDHPYWQWNLVLFVAATVFDGCRAEHAQGVSKTSKSCACSSTTFASTWRLAAVCWRCLVKAERARTTQTWTSFLRNLASLSIAVYIPL